MTEIGSDNRKIVREHGSLPGIGFGAEYSIQDWQFALKGELHQNDITYDGRLQSGARFISETETTQRRIGFEIGKQITEATQLTAAVEQDYWQRNILGRESVAGMQEKYASWRLLTGAKSRVVRWNGGVINMKVALVFARPEKLRVRFDQQLFDDVTFRTKSGVGLRLGIGFQPKTLPNLSVDVDFDWIEIARSDNAVLSRNGTPAGTVAQSKHERAAFGLRANYRF